MASMLWCVFLNAVVKVGVFVGVLMIVFVTHP